MRLTGGGRVTGLERAQRVGDSSTYTSSYYALCWCVWRTSAFLPGAPQREQPPHLGRVSKAPVTITRCSEAGVNRYFSGGCGGYGVAVAGDRVQRRLTETGARTRRSEWCQALYCEG
ncbi:hypothetical protein Mame01_29920 [Microbispora amethystogenes]|nr:hypothetical protein Mame01_29920 [Microbispora amethystogenes]